MGKIENSAATTCTPTLTTAIHVMRANRLTTITQGSAVASIGYDVASRRTLLTMPGGISAIYAYDHASELTGITWKRGSTTLGTLTYGYDGVGRLTSRGGTLFQSALPASASSATYDLANRRSSHRMLFELRQVRTDHER